MKTTGIIKRKGNECRAICKPEDLIMPIDPSVIRVDHFGPWGFDTQVITEEKRSMEMTETQVVDTSYDIKAEVDHKEDLPEGISECPQYIASPEMRLLRAKSLSEWTTKINEIQDKTVRDKVFCIVWWDFFGGLDAGKNKEVEDARPKFGVGNGASELKVIAELKVIGYPDKFAERRGKEPKTYIDNREWSKRVHKPKI